MVNVFVPIIIIHDRMSCIWIFCIKRVNQNKVYKEQTEPTHVRGLQQDSSDCPEGLHILQSVISDMYVHKNSTEADQRLYFQFILHKSSDFGLYILLKYSFGPNDSIE